MCIRDRKINRIEIEERPLPTEEQLLDRIRERLAVKVEHEIRHLPVRERAQRIDRLIPLVQQMATTEEGRRELAAICASYLREHRPETTVDEESARQAEPAPEPGAGASRRGGSEGRRGSGGRGRGRRPRRRR